MTDHAHEYERGVHMAEAFGIGGRVWACAICGTPRPERDDAARILRLLNNASVPQADLAFVLGLSIRQVQSALQSLRLEGKPVLSDGDGIRLAQTADEARACADALRRRLRSQYRTYRALRNTARAMHLAENRPPEVEAPEGSLWSHTTAWAVA
jgi:biotin operon repressor